MVLREKVGGSIIQGIITAILKPETISTIVAGAAALAAPLIAPALAELPGGQNPYGKVGIWFVLGLAALILITFVRMIFRLPFIRRLRKKHHPYEGVWLDVYSVKDETVEGFKPVPQRSVFVIYLDTVRNK